MNSSMYDLSWYGVSEEDWDSVDMSIREDGWYFPAELDFNRNDCISSIPEVENLREEWRKSLEKADFSVKDSLEEDEDLVDETDEKEDVRDLS